MAMVKFSRGKAAPHVHQFVARADGSVACTCGAVKPNP